MLSAIQIPDRDPLVGALLDDRYHVTGVLGRGGMGIVYEGLHQPLGRAVAIKVLGHNTARDPLVVARFLLEARVASGLAHGNIVDVSDLGRLPDGRPYLVMPKVAGIDFATLLEREGPMAPARVANLLRGVAAALDLVHAKGLVHRDVKPENLMHVLRADGSETVMLLDFGIAALLPDNDAGLTPDNAMCGSPAYMAPELIATGTFDRRADVYALATVAFELLAGRLPFDDGLPARVMMTKTSRAAPTLSETAKTPFSEDIERVIARGLARAPAERYASAGEFLAEFAQAALQGRRAGDFTQGGRSSPAPSAPVADAAASDSTRRAASVITQASPRAARLVAVASAVSVGALFAWWLVLRSELPSQAPAARAAMKAPALVAHSAVEQHDDAMALQANKTEPETAHAELLESPRVVETPAVPPRTTARNTTRGLRRPPPVTLPAAGAATAEATLPTTPSDAASDTLTANRELLEGHLAHAAELFERALQHNAHDLVALRGLGLADESLGRSEEAVRAYRSALELEPDATLAPKLRERLERLGAEP